VYLSQEKKVDTKSISRKPYGGNFNYATKKKKEVIVRDVGAKD